MFVVYYYVTNQTTNSLSKPLCHKSCMYNKHWRDSVLFIGTQFSNLYIAVDTPARGRVVVCLVCVCLVFVCKYVLGHSRVSQSLNLRLCLLRHFGFLDSPYAIPSRPAAGAHPNSFRLPRRSTPAPHPISWAPFLHLPTSPRSLLCTPTMTTYLTTA